MPAPVSLRLHDSPRYEEFYGFAHLPFAPGADPRFLYPATPQQAALDRLLDAVRRREPVAVLTGRAGTGKTTVCRALPGRLDAATVTSLILEPGGTAEELLRSVLLDLGVLSRRSADGGRAAAATRQELADILRTFLRSLAPLDATCVVIVDDAHRLSPEAIAEIGGLSSAGTGESGLLAFVLAGAPDLLDSLARPEAQALDARIAVRATLEPLASADVAPYIEHRLSAAGAADPPRFDAAAAEAVYQHTRGVPAAVNSLCAQALMLGAQLGVRVIGREVIEEVARGDASAESGATAWWTRPSAWIWIAVAILVLAAIMAVSFSGAA